MVVDVGECLVLLCYLEEGDGFLSPRVWRRIKTVDTKLEQMLRPSGQNGFHCPNLRALATALYADQGPTIVAAKILETLDKGKDVLSKWKELLSVTWKTQMKVWRFCQLFDPAYVSITLTGQLQLDLLCIDAVKALPAPAYDELLASLAAYKTSCEGLGQVAGCDLLHFWRTHASELPAWSAAAKVACTIQPSSAGAERVFALLHWMFKGGQNSTFEDYKKLSCIMRYNRSWELKVEELMRSLNLD